MNRHSRQWADLVVHTVQKPKKSNKFTSTEEAVTTVCLKLSKQVHLNYNTFNAPFKTITNNEIEQ